MPVRFPTGSGPYNALRMERQSNSRRVRSLQRRARGVSRGNLFGLGRLGHRSGARALVGLRVPKSGPGSVGRVHPALASLVGVARRGRDCRRGRPGASGRGTHRRFGVSLGPGRMARLEKPGYGGGAGRFGARIFSGASKSTESGAVSSGRLIPADGNERYFLRPPASGGPRGVRAGPIDLPLSRPIPAPHGPRAGGTLSRYPGARSRKRFGACSLSRSGFALARRGGAGTKANRGGPQIRARPSLSRVRASLGSRGVRLRLDEGPRVVRRGGSRRPTRGAFYRR